MDEKEWHLSLDLNADQQEVAIGLLRELMLIGTFFTSAIEQGHPRVDFIEFGDKVTDFLEGIGEMPPQE